MKGFAPVCPVIFRTGCMSKDEGAKDWKNLVNLVYGWLLASGWLHEPCIDGLAPDKNEDAPAEVIRVAA